MISTGCAGLLGFVFTDFGQNHHIFDKNGEPKKHILISGITQEGVVTTEENKRHDLEEGDLVKVHEVIGFDNINERVFEVQKVLSPFSIQLDFQGVSGSFLRNGFLEEEKKVIQMSFKSLR